jgi:hypothetical protein
MCLKANKAFDTQSVELAKLRLELEKKNVTIKDFIQEKPVVRVQAPRLKHLVGQAAIEAAREEHRRDNAPAQPRATLRQRDKMRT